MHKRSKGYRYIKWLASKEATSGDRSRVNRAILHLSLPLTLFVELRAT